MIETDEYRNGYIDTKEDILLDKKQKVFNDPIHGHMQFHPLCIKIIDTPQFQRLRNIKQLGTCYLVYPGATHTRFEHSLGVSHLAGKLLRAIKERQPISEDGEELVSDKDILCVEIAGLCHDLGHGPFSHLFDQKIIPIICPGSKWNHEKASVMMFDFILNDNCGKMRKEFEKLMDDFKEEDIIFIKELIDVPAAIGKDVVANKTNGIDVDKWDYLARDCYMLGMNNSFDHDRCISSARVLIADGRSRICYRKEEAHDLYDMFRTRMTLHRKAYQHKTHYIIGTMMCDALVAANDYITFEGQNGYIRSLVHTAEGQKYSLTRCNIPKRMSEAIYDMKAYTQLTDSVVRKILLSKDMCLQKSRDLLNDIMHRKLYKLIAHTQKRLTSDAQVVKAAILKKLIADQVTRKHKDVEELTTADLIIDVVKVDYGVKNQDPLLNVRFYRKEDENTAIAIERKRVSDFLPDTFAEQYILVYCKKTEQELVVLTREAFSNWCLRNDCPQPKEDETDSFGMECK